MLNVPVPYVPQVDVTKQAFARPKQNWRDGDMELIDEADSQELLDGVGTAADSHIPAIRCLACLLEGRVDSVGDKVERRVALHPQRRPRMVRQHENRYMVRRVIAPPTFPLQVRPKAPNRAEHVATQDPRTDILETACGELVIDPRRAALFAEDVVLERASRVEALMQFRPTLTERILEVLVRASSISIE